MANIFWEKLHVSQFEDLPHALWFYQSAIYQVWGIHGERQVQQGQ